MVVEGTDKSENASEIPAIGIAANHKPVWAKGDHEKAYRNWPVHQEDQPLLATLVWDKTQQCFRVFVHLALPFRGNSGSMALYKDKPRGLRHSAKIVRNTTNGIRR